MATTIYVCVGSDGAEIKRFTKRQRAIDEYNADSSKKIVGVVTYPGGKAIIGEGDFPSEALQEPSIAREVKPKAERKPVDPDARRAAAKARFIEMTSREHVDYPDNKVCRRCKIDKPRDDFNKDHSIKDGLRQWCKACYSEHAKQKRAAAKKEVAA